MKRSRDPVVVDHSGNLIHDDRPRILGELRRVWRDAGFHFSSENRAWKDPTIPVSDLDPLELFERLQ